MKSLRFLLMLICIVFFSLSAFRPLKNSVVKGSINPPDASIRAWLASKTDTISGPIQQGNFSINDVKPGIYMIMVEGIPPYRNTIKEGINVVEGQPTDVGVIEMQRQ